MNCKTLCGKTIRRPHITCLFCRRRRLYYGKVKAEDYEAKKIVLATRGGAIVMPKKKIVYVLIIDKKRRFVAVKTALLKRLLTICELLSN